MKEKIKMKLGLTIWILLIMPLFVLSQNDSCKIKFARHIISLHETSDFNLSQYGYDTKNRGNYPYKYAYYFHSPFNSLRGFYSYSVGLDYEYRAARSVSINTGLYFSKQGFFLSRTNPIENRVNEYEGFDYYVSYIYFPVGIKVSFLNKFCIRPVISFDLINAFLMNEKADIYLAHWEHLIMKSDVVKYYFLKPQITLGCDFYIKKKFRLGVEMVWKGNAFYHTDKTLPTRFKYTNLNFGLSFGYVIK